MATNVDRTADAVVERLLSAVDRKIGSGPTIDMASHEADKQRRRKERAAKEPILRACLDPTIAAKYELEKPRFRFVVKAEFEEMDPKTLARTPFHREAKVIAQNEADAWATACDEWQTSQKPVPGSKQVSKGKQVPIEEFLAEQNRPRDATRL